VARNDQGPSPPDRRQWADALRPLLGLKAAKTELSEVFWLDEAQKGRETLEDTRHIARQNRHKFADTFIPHRFMVILLLYFSR
jgi:hypothetical protein